MKEPLFDPQNAAYVQLLYEEFARNPEGVPPAWRAFFSRGLEALASEGLLPPDPWVGRTALLPPPTPSPVRSTDAEKAPAAFRELLAVVARAASLVQAFRAHGHMRARLDPLGSEPPGHPELDPAFFGTSMEELRSIPASVVEPRWGEESLAEVLRRLERTYCGSSGYEFEHLEDPDKARWLWEQVESGAYSQPLSEAQKRRLLKRLSEVEGLEHFLHRTYLGQKRFSIEGTDMLVPMLDEAMVRIAEQGGREVIIGMAHRGRLNVLAHIVGVPYREILKGFEGKAVPAWPSSAHEEGTGDVKYHLGSEGAYPLPNGGDLKVSLAPNPSHLEFVNPVVEGMVRARQFGGPGRETTQDLDAVVPILVHGDAAFAAEGVVAETLNLARLRGFSTGGTLHIIVNNQVGFTTDAKDGRSTRYASDLAKGYDIPVIHVNADDPEACLSAVRLALAYRARFHDDVVIDLVGYRRHGHNEGDEPTYTQPGLYRAIAGHSTVRALWAEKLQRDGLVNAAEARAIQEEAAKRLRAAQQEAQAEPDSSLPAPQGETDEGSPPPDTGVPMEVLLKLNGEAHAYPDDFRVHPKLARHLRKRAEAVDAHSSIEWAHAETIAFATLLAQGIPVRITGQDSERGTFSQRHLVLHDVENGDRFVPLSRIGPARFEVYNSPLSETAVLGFEYGYDLGSGDGLILWEAQFGDFVNVAQVILDQFLSSGRAKWGQLSRLVVLLPHGHEGQGPEHTSARPERFLQLAAEENMRITFPSTPAQYFHLLRRQALHPKARPLVVFTPKSLLRHPRATSPLSDLVLGRFQPVLGPGVPQGEDRQAVTRLILCSGKIAYELEGHPRRGELPHLAVARLEELYPFPAQALAEVVAAFPHLQEVFWVQEEPANQGALSFLGPRLREVVPRSVSLRYAARPHRASPAEGRLKDHLAAQERVLEEALGLRSRRG